MNRRTTITIAIALMVALAALPLGAAGVFASEYDQEQPDETDAESVTPGEQLSGVVGVHEAEVQGELSDRTYGIKLANAESDDERADVVEEQLADVEERLNETEQRLADLEEQREAGEISDGQYRAAVAPIAAEMATTERTAEAAQATAEELPADLLEERGIDVEAIEDLRDRANELDGQEIAEIATSIAGDAVGQSPAPDREPGAPIETPGQDRTDDGDDQRAGDDETADSSSDSSGSDEPDDEQRSGR